jgi:flavin reductase
MRAALRLRGADAHDRRMSWIDQRPDDAMAGAFDAIGPQPVSTVDAHQFREAMSRLGAAVHVITTAGPGGRAGVTATAVCSVSDQPPTLLACLNRRAYTCNVLGQNGVFCVNVLRADAEAIADVFAGRGGLAMEERFGSAAWTQLATGAPVLESAVVSFDCRVVEVKSVATHNVFFGIAEAVRLGPSGPALLYHERGYKQV